MIGLFGINVELVLEILQNASRGFDDGRHHIIQF